MQYFTFGCSEAYLMQLEDLDIMIQLNLVEYFFSHPINFFLVIYNNGKNVIPVKMLLINHI